MNVHAAPILTTERLTLRPFASDDLDALAAIYADPGVMRFIGSGVRTRERTAADIAAYGAEWREHGRGVWAVTETATGQLLGMCGFVERAELGYIFGRFAWGRGIATEAARTCLHFGFARLGYDVIGAGALKENHASLRILEKLGMHPAPNAHYDDHGGAYCTITRAERPAEVVKRQVP